MGTIGAQPGYDRRGTMLRDILYCCLAEQHYGVMLLVLTLAIGDPPSLGNNILDEPLDQISRIPAIRWIVQE